MALSKRQTGQQTATLALRCVGPGLATHALVFTGTEIIDGWSMHSRYIAGWCRSGHQSLRRLGNPSVISRCPTNAAQAGWKKIDSIRPGTAYPS